MVCDGVEVCIADILVHVSYLTPCDQKYRRLGNFRP